MAGVVVAGSRNLPHGYAPVWLIRFLHALPAETTVNLRAGLRQIGHFEIEVYELCDALRLETVWWSPQPVPEAPGRQATWERDYNMVEESDVVLAFVTTYDLEREDLDSGTAKLVEKAQDREKSAYLYGVEPDGTLYLAGASDVHNVWARIVPHPRAMQPA